MKLGRRAAALALIVPLGLSACGAGSEETEADGSAADSVIALPPTVGVFDYQLGGISDRIGEDEAPLDVVVRDATATPAPGAYSICYVNGFQTQPGQEDQWEEHPELLLRDDAGEPLVDPDWPDEFILDPSTPVQREGILEVIGPVIEGCAGAGYEGIEIDNLDTWTRFEQIDAAGARELARAYVERAHTEGLAIGQKNAAEITELAHEELGFDFAVVEECAAYAECTAYTEVYGEHVLQIEYPDSLEEQGLAFDAACADPDRAPLTILRDRDLVAPEDPGYLHQTC